MAEDYSLYFTMQKTHGLNHGFSVGLKVSTTTAATMSPIAMASAAPE